MCLREKIFIDVCVSLIHYLQLVRTATLLHYILELCLLKSALAVIADAILFLVTVCKNRKLQKKRERGREKKKSAACRDGQQLHRSVRKLNFVARRHSCHFPSLGVLPTCWSFDLFHRLPHYVYSACFHMAH